LDRRKDWADWLHKLPGRTKGSIGLVGLLISSVVLFRDNVQLGLVVTLALALTGASALGAYVAFTKQALSIVAGRCGCPAAPSP